MNDMDYLNMEKNPPVGSAFHWRDGWYFQRTQLDAVLVTLPNQWGQIVIPPNEWASIVAHVSARSESAATWTHALAFHSEGVRGESVEAQAAQTLQAERDSAVTEARKAQQKLEHRTLSMRDVVQRRDELSARVHALESALRAWRGWAQFVYLGGGPVVLDDEGLRDAVCAENDKPILRVRELEDAARAACEACRGSGVVAVWDSARRGDWHQQTCPVCHQHAAIPATALASSSGPPQEPEKT